MFEGCKPELKILGNKQLQVNNERKSARGVSLGSVSLRSKKCCVRYFDFFIFKGEDFSSYYLCNVDGGIRYLRLLSVEYADIN